MGVIRRGDAFSSATFRKFQMGHLPTSRSFTDADTTNLLERWRTTRDRRARDELFTRFLPLARRLARRYSQSGAGVEDVLQVAGLGLLNALERFEPERGISFTTFAVPTILGEIKRHFRDSGWAAHVPRHAQELALKVESGSRRLSAGLGRSPRVSEIAQYLEISTEEVLDGLTAGGAHFSTSLDVPARSSDEDGDLTLGDTLGAEDDAYALVDTTLSLAAAMPRLPFRQRQALALRLNENLVQSEIAERMGCSQMQISRLLRDAATQLRAMMDAASV
jgi:RNA polymerase sigma-B factor